MEISEKVIANISASLANRFQHQKNYDLFYWADSSRLRNDKHTPRMPDYNYWKTVWIDDPKSCTSNTGWSKVHLELSKLKSSFNSREGRFPPKIGDCILNAVKEYNPRAISEKWTFNILNRDDLKGELINTVPLIVDCARKLEQHLAHPVPLLKAGQDGCLYISQQLACSLLANAFLCTLRNRDNSKLPEIHFYGLFESLHDKDTSMKVEKLRCLLNYFKRMGGGTPNRILSFERRVLQHGVAWENSHKLLSKVIVNTNGAIEEAYDTLQVDFANKIIGGGILGHGMVMEEIRFSISPELIVARLFTEKLEDNEVLVVTGCEQFSKYEGYSSSFTYNGNFKDCQKSDDCGRLMTQIVAIDALHFKQFEKVHYQISKMDRELNKCFCAFKPFASTEQQLKPIATGNWGCGAFNGDPQLKFLIQWLAASEAEKRDLNYFTFKDERQSQGIQVVVDSLKHETVGKIYQLIKRFERVRSSEDIFDFIKGKRGGMSQSRF